MASITVRNLNDEVKKRLRKQAAEQGVSLEQEVRNILSREVSRVADHQVGLGEAIRRRFAADGGVELPLPIRRGRKAPDLR
jgi:plasmid stability protein